MFNMTCTICTLFDFWGKKTDPIRFILLTTPSNICLFAVDNTFLLNNSSTLISEVKKGNFSSNKKKEQK